MKLTLTNNRTFKGNIIDSHAHIGEWQNNSNYGANSLNSIASDSFEITVNGQRQKDGIECFLVSNLSSMYEKESGKFAKDETQGNEEILKIARQNSKIKVALACEPRLGSADKIETLLKAHKDNVYGLKFHPMTSNLSPQNPKYAPYMALAQKYKKPCVFHSDRIDTKASPRAIYELARKTPEIPVVLYHMSMASSVATTEPISHLPKEELTQKNLDSEDKINEFEWNNRERWNQDGIDVVRESLEKKDANLYLETSWTKPETVVKAIKEVGEDKVLFGTDAPFDGREKYIQYVSEVKTAIKKEFGEKSENIINKVFFENANKLFFDGKLKMTRHGETIANTTNQASNTSHTSANSTESLKKSKALPIVLGILALCGLGAALYSHNKKDSKTNLRA